MDVPGVSDSAEIRAFGQEARSRSNADLANTYSADLGQARGLLQDSGGADKAMGYQNPSLAAIKSKYGQDYSRMERGIKLDNIRSANEDNIKKLQIANQLANEELALNRQREALKNKMKAAKKAARGAMIGNILGVAGGGAALALSGGNPYAGMAGMGGGQAIGNFAGGQ